VLHEQMPTELKQGKKKPNQKSYLFYTPLTEAEKLWPR